MGTMRFEDFQDIISSEMSVLISDLEKQQSLKVVLNSENQLEFLKEKEINFEFLQSIEKKLEENSFLSEGISPGEKDKEIYTLLNDLNFTYQKFKSILRWTKTMQKLNEI